MKALLLAAVVLFVFRQRKSGAERAQGYPSRPVRIIVPFAPGGVTDVMARLLAQKLSESLGKEFFVDNRPGAGGNIGIGATAQAAADGYTIALTSSSYVVNPALNKKVPYDPEKDLVPVTISAVSPNAVVVNPNLPVRTIAELIDHVRRTGNQNFASAGVGTTPHLSGELFRLSLNLDMVHVPFNGAGPALQSVIAGHTPIAFTAFPPAVPLVKAGSLRALAVTSAERLKALPDVPTMAEAGQQGQEAETMLLFSRRPQRPNRSSICSIAKLQRSSPCRRRRRGSRGSDSIRSRARPKRASFACGEELARWGKVIRDARIEVP